MAINKKELSEAGTQFYPETHIEAVIDGNGNTLDTLLSGKQDTLVSGTSIKTVNSTSLLGSGNVSVGTYSKPSGGIPKTDLASAVQTSLGLADTALQSFTESDPVFGASAAHGISSSDISAWNGKQDAISDLSDIRSGAEAGATAYQLPSTGIPKTDLASAVQTSLGKADTALQSFTETDPVFSASAAAGISSSDITNWNGKTSNIGTITSVKMNGSTVSSSGEADLGTVITSHQDISGKADKVSLATNGNFAGLDSNGNLVDSGHKHSDYLTSLTETDPTVPSWAKESSKPSYTLDEVADGSTRKLSDYQPVDADLTAIAGLSGTSGLLKKTAANTWSLDTNTYYYSGNSNKNDVDWTASKLSANNLSLVYKSGTFTSQKWVRIYSGSGHGYATITVTNSYYQARPFSVTFHVNVGYSDAALTQISSAGSEGANINKARVIFETATTWHVDVYYNLTSSNPLNVTAVGTGNLIQPITETLSEGSYAHYDLNFTVSGLAVMGSIDASGSLNLINTANTNGRFFFKTYDATLKIYPTAGAVPSYGTETMAFQSSFDQTDPETSGYPGSYGDRCVIALQPRGGRVGVGTSSPGKALSVTGDINATGTITPGSDSRIKDDQQEIDVAFAMEIIDRLAPKTWTWNEKTDNEGKKAAGLIAQEVMNIIPDAVEINAGCGLDDFHYLNYNTVQGYEIAAIKGLIKENKALKSEVAELKEKMNAIMEMLK